MLAEQMPYSEITAVWNLPPKVINEGYRPQIDSSWDSSLSRLIVDSWHAQPERRPTSAELLNALEGISTRFKRAHLKVKRSQSDNTSQIKSDGDVLSVRADDDDKKSQQLSIGKESHDDIDPATASHKSGGGGDNDKKHRRSSSRKKKEQRDNKK